MTIWTLRRPSISARLLRHFREYKMSYRLSVGLAMMAVLVGWLNIRWYLALCIIFSTYLASGGWRFVRLLCLTFSRDLSGLKVLLKLMINFRRLVRNKTTMTDIFQKTAAKHGDKVAFVFEEKYWTFQEVEYFSNKVANYFKGIGYRKDAVADISSSLTDVELYEFGNESSAGLKSENILEKFKTCSENPPSVAEELRHDDVLFYIYTSGTTGLPKASVIKHSRFFQMSFSWDTVLKLSPDDVLYCVLPLYHSSAGILGVSSVITCGATMVVRRKFSASRFWEECIKYKATGAIYIGELCRYLLAQPPKANDKKHSLRFMSGNGLRPQIWKEFKTRFDIPYIGEFYGATEGNIALMNIPGHPGAMGFLPATIPWVHPVRVFKIDISTGELARGSNGLCIPCNPGETGQIAGRIEKRDLARHFDGYVNKNATKKKIACDVLKKGDQWFLSGDVVYWDELGYLYFHDRLGDTFRWRGENVSTSEVEGVMANVLGLNSVVVYGVEIPGCEGRAGMAAIEDPDDVIDVRFISKRLPEVLPSYARPVFLRVTNIVDTTGTFKFQKTKFRKEGFDLSVVHEDKLFYLDLMSGEYCVLTREVYEKIMDGEMRF